MTAVSRPFRNAKGQFMAVILLPCTGLWNLKGVFMTTLNQTYSGTKNPEPSARELAHAKLARDAAAEGMVLLKNEDLLPLNTADPVALFGGGAVITIKGGTGSGDVNNRENISVYKGLKDAGVSITSENWISDYNRRYTDARNTWKEKILCDAEKTENPFDAYALNPFALPSGRSITEADTKGARTAVYVISRICGEGMDRRRTEGDYYLSSQEKEDLLCLNRQNIPIVLLLNAGASVELTDILQDAENIRAVLYISLPGQEGGHAVADVLFGKICPSGKLTSTWAKRYEHYPSAENFSYLNGNLDTEEYREGIFVGYRYFDSFGIKPLFPFGFGLSYTRFSIQCNGIQAADDRIEVTVTVSNTGEHCSGKEVVQVYLTPPQTNIAKECRRLAGFAKTNLLPPKGMQQLKITIDQKQLASYSAKQHAWVIDSGQYAVWTGNSIASLQLAALITIKQQKVIEQTENVCPKTAAFEDLKPSEDAVRRVNEWIASAMEQDIPCIQFEPKKEKRKIIQTPPLRKTEKYSISELIPLLYGNITKGASTLGSSGKRVPGSAGETTEALEDSYGIRSLIMADGPAGLRLRQSYEVDRKTGSVYGAGVLASLENGFLEELTHHEDADTYYQYCTAFPVGTAMAQTWNTSLLQKFGRAIAEEMEEFHVDLWLAPGMNIHRNPLCGRNFEYFSEDPLLSGIMAAAVTNGVQKDRKCGVTIKHFACNNQEDNRMSVNACVSAQALREIYFRGFEIAVKTSAPAAIMTSYNKINGVHAANSKDLCTEVARSEWGFEGVIMSDWNTTVPKDGSIPWQCAAAGNDIIMPGNEKDDENIRKAYASGNLSEESIRSCSERILTLIRKM